MMTPGQISRILQEEFGGYGIEDVIEAVQLWVESDRESVIDSVLEGDPPDVEVIECLDACIEHLENARTSYYASFK